ncbi:MAG TPA: DNA polymerase/3'-5' exonuclease PolX [Candidatus Eisenbacteria bacterium]|nr:DNA polymerase/3'-5' exonuclease PolX [Candidatus Eisenbacteria bacterium]
MTNDDIARVFSRLATMLEIDGANPFRVRAYREAARVLGELLEPAAGLDVQALKGLPGIGGDLAVKIRDVIDTGTTALFEETKLKVPLEVVALTELQGMGPKRVKMLLDRGIKNRDQLEQAARSGALRELPGFGETLVTKLIKAIESAARIGGRPLLSAAWPVAEALVARFRQIPGVTQTEATGSFRRRRETVGDLDILVSGGDAARVMGSLTEYSEVGEILGRGDSKSSVRLKSGLQVDVRLVPEEGFGAALLYFTGSKAHNIALRKIAIDKGWMLNEYGLFDDGTRIAGRTEEEVYHKLGMDWIPPELREARDEIERAWTGTLPKLIELEDLRGDLHLHTDRTDGRESLETVVKTAKAKGYAYCAITDHSQSLTMANGFDTARVRRSVEEIEAVRRAVPGIRVLHGLEVDILGDGSLDLDDEGLGLLDWVIVSLHSRLTQPRAEMTARVLKALAHPAVHVMGHPTARMLGKREPVDLDIEAVLDAAAAHGVLMEINSQPHRVDLCDLHARMAKERGIKLVINTDGHTLVEMDQMRYGIFSARRAGLEKGDVLNTLEADELLDAVRRKAPAVKAVSKAAAKAAKPAAPPKAAAKRKAAAPRARPKRAR